MDMREQFGKYLLLKKLTEDPMGETFRAGLLGSKGMERVALLRIFNGQGLDGGRLWQSVESRTAIQEALKSPNIGEGIEMGQLEGIPYVAYDYVSGKNMAKLLEQAAKKRNFVPAEHALLITERIALALASAAETRFGGDRIHHGFVVPHLAIISNEGETRLLGFEYGPGLRSFAQNPVIRQHFGRYLAPEALAGSPPHPLDDIYSLGVILYELLTGRPLPPPAQDGFGSVIDQGVVATEGTPIPPELVTLLKQSLVPRDHRVKDVATWHKTLNTYMFEGQYNPTTFNLAFFMHNLFRQEIERESQEIEVEKTLPLPTVQEKKEATSPGVEAPPLPAAAAAVPAQAPPGEGTAPGTGEKTENFIPEYAKEEKSKAGLIAGVLAAVLVLAAAGFYFMQGGSTGAPETTQAAPPPPPPPAEPEYTGPSQEELQSQIAELVSQQSELLQQQYDDKLADLQAQLEKAQQEEARRREAEAKAKADRERQAAEEAAAEAAEEERLAEEAAAKKAEEEAAAKKAEEEAAEEAEPPPAEPPPTQVAETKPPPKPKAPAAPQVRRGDLVEPGPGVVLPDATRPVKPRYPEMAKRFNKTQATVVVRVLIDENGKVLKAELAGERQKFGFDTEALQAAKRSQWRPATKNGVPVKIWHTLSIEFRE